MSLAHIAGKIDADLHRRLTEAAASRGMTKMALIEQAVAEHLDGMSGKSVLRAVKALTDRQSTVENQIGVIANFIVDAYRSQHR